MHARSSRARAREADRTQRSDRASSLSLVQQRAAKTAAPQPGGRGRRTPGVEHGCVELGRRIPLHPFSRTGRSHRRAGSRAASRSGASPREGQIPNLLGGSESSRCRQPRPAPTRHPCQTSEPQLGRRLEDDPQEPRRSRGYSRFRSQPMVICYSFHIVSMR